jgi:hypothetical protein
MNWRVVGLIESQMHSASPDAAKSAVREMHAVEEFAAECSMVKVYASEMLDYVVDEGVQIHGGYGFHQDYAVERYYRDARINRLFEGTSEINRLVITGMPLKRAARGQLPLLDAAHEVLSKIEKPDSASEKRGSSEEARLVRNAKQIALLTLGVAYEKYGVQLEKQQEVIMNISDIITEVFAMESSLLRCQKLAAAGQGTNASDFCSVYLRDAITRIETFSRAVLSACSEGDGLHKRLTALRSYADHEPVNSVALRRKIAARLLSAEKYMV